MSNEFVGQFYEIEQLKKEVKRLKNILDIERKRVNTEIKKKNTRIAELQEQIIKGLKETGAESAEYKGKVYKAEPKIRRIRKKEDVKKSEILQILEKVDIGADHVEEVYKELTNALKGEEFLEWSLK